MAIFIFANILWDSHTITAKIYKNDPQTLSETIRIVETFNAAQQETAMLIPYMASMMCNNDRCFVCGQTGHFGHHCPNAQCYSCIEFGHFAEDCPSKIPPSETPCHQDRSHSSHNTPTPKGTDHNPLTIDTDMVDISTNHNHTANPTTTGAAVTDGMYCTPHPSNAVACTAPRVTDALITTHAKTHLKGIVTPHLEHAISPTDITHATTPWTIASLTLATLSTLHKDHIW